MKYFKWSFISLLLVVFLTGCGSSAGGNKLVCSQKSDEEGISTEMKYTIEFKDEKPSIVDVETKSIATSKDMKDNWDMLAGFMELGFSMFKDKAGITVTSNNDAKKYTYTLNMKIDLAKVETEDLEELDMSDMTDSVDKETLKKELVAEGFTCK